ncbi:MAG: sulfatase-like hydrolase/transferase [Acidobacteria bacterium]|nr:sulfatase-like hydrolase/transferase [Acidobacteriota bacterium]
MGPTPPRTRRVRLRRTSQVPGQRIILEHPTQGPNLPPQRGKKRSPRQRISARSHARFRRRLHHPVYYPLPHLHTEIRPTPDSAPVSPPARKDLYDDNIRYMDKIVGKLVAELERLKLRNKTLIIFVGDNGTAGGAAARSSIGGRRLSGAKGSMLEGGALVPLIANWPGKTPSGKVTPHLVDSTDFHPTFAELAGVKLPTSNVIDGRSFAPQLRGTSNQPTREWIFIQLARQWYVRDAKWKLDQAGALYDMSKAPFEEPLVATESKDPAAVAARQRLQAALTKLNPAGGILDEGDGTGRHANRDENKKKKKKK